MNFAGLPSGADDRYFYDANHNRLGQLGSKLNLVDVSELGLVDEWLGIDVSLRAGAPTSFWTYPIETVSQSESGFELVHQSVVVQPHWYVLPDNQGRWSVTMQMVVDTQRAEQRLSDIPAVAAAT
jgi:alpha-amylase